MEYYSFPLLSDEDMEVDTKSKRTIKMRIVVLYLTILRRTIHTSTAPLIVNPLQPPQLIPYLPPQLSLFSFADLYPLYRNIWHCKDAPLGTPYVPQSWKKLSLALVSLTCPL